MMKILIATANPGKFHEFTSEFRDLPFKFVSLKDAGLDKTDVDEPFGTTWENARHKALFYGKKSKLLTIAEDTGFFVDYLKGKPGVNVKRAAPTEKERLNKILSALKNVPKKKRGAYFETSACLFNPKTESVSIFKGVAKGIVTSKIVGGGRAGVEHDAIFYYPPLKKTFAELSVADKNLVSHRGQILNQLKQFIGREYGFRHLVVALGIVIKNGKILLMKRRDARPEFNGVWEFPGGGVDAGETVEGCLLREVKEESGFKVKILEAFPHVWAITREKYNYQVFLKVYLCQPIAGKLALRDNETSDHRWVTLKEALKIKQYPFNKNIIRLYYQTMIKYIR